MKVIAMCIELCAAASFVLKDNSTLIRFRLGEAAPQQGQLLL